VHSYHHEQEQISEAIDRLAKVREDIEASRQEVRAVLEMMGFGTVTRGEMH
jgi:hypothetical protein